MFTMKGYYNTNFNAQKTCLVDDVNQSTTKDYISGLKETFMKRYRFERSTKAEIRPEEQNEKAESCGENLWNEIRSKGP